MKFSISSISFTNYRQYKGTQEINFSANKSKNVGIVLGRNGAGKSNFLNALTWCFYGSEVHKEEDQKDSESMPIINTSVLEAIENGESTFAEVVIHLDTNGGPWTIKRSLAAHKDERGNIRIEPKTELIVIHRVNGQDKVEKGDNTEILVQNLLPKALMNFFFIDGEQLREFFKVSTPLKISNAVDKVSQLELVYKSKKNFTKVERALRTNLKNTTPKLDYVHKSIKERESKIEEIESFIKNTSKQHGDQVDDLNRVKSFLKDSSSSTISQLESERQSLEKDLKEYNTQIENLEGGRNRYLVEMAPFIYLKTTLNKAYSLIDQKVEKGELPAKIKENFVQELLGKGRCICGNELDESSRNELELYVKKLALSELSEVSIMGKTTIASIFLRIEEFPEKIDQMNADIDKLKSILEEKVRRLEQISEKINESNIEEVKRYEEQRDNLIRRITQFEQAIKLSKAELEEYTKDLNSLKEQEIRELAKTTKNALVKTKLSLVKDAINVLDETENVIKTKIRRQVEKTTKENFMTLIRKKSAFKDITIDENYTVRVEHSHGYNVINDLSAGEYLILGLAFMSSLMSISGFQAPVIIDTPLGKIDDEHRDFITTELPRFLEGTQLLLLVTPTEYDSNVKENLDNYLVKNNYHEICENTMNTESRIE